MNVNITLLTPTCLPSDSQTASNIVHDLKCADQAPRTRDRLVALVADLRAELGKLTTFTIDGRLSLEIHGGYCHMAGQLNIYDLTDVAPLRTLLTAAKRILDEMWATQAIMSFRLTFTQEFVVRATSQAAPQPAHA